jgi:hypothetical protein
MRPLAALLAALALAAWVVPDAGADAPAVARARWRVPGAEQSAGTVFFLETPSGVVAVGAAHSFDLARLARAEEVVFELGRTRQPVARSARLLAQPGLPFSAPGGTLRDDLVLFALDAPPQHVRVLRAGGPAREGERVVLLGIPGSIPRDEDDVFGRVRERDALRLEVELDVAVDLRGWGGAPLLSRDDGRVLGVLQAAWPSGSTLRVAASPVAAVLEAAGRPLDGGRGAPFASFAGEAAARARAAPPEPAAAARAEPSPRAAPPPPPHRPAARGPDAPRPIVRAEDRILEAGRLWLEIEYPDDGAVVSSPQGAFVAGRALAPRGSFRQIDVVFVLDTSASTNDPSGADVNGNGVVGQATFGGVGSLFGLGPTDPGDSILAAEVAAARRLLARLDPRSTRVGLVTFAGEPPQDGFLIGARAPSAALTEVALTSDYASVQRALDRVLERGPYGATHMAAGVDQALIELKGLRGAFSKADPNSEKIVVFLTDGQPTLPYGAHAESRNVEAVLRAAERSRRSSVRVFTFGIGEEALEGPLAIVGLAERTGGGFTPVRDPAVLADLIEDVDFANLERLTVRNVTRGEEATTLATGPDGSFGALVALAPGKNRIEVRARSSDGQETTAEVWIQHAPGAKDPPVPEALVASRNRLLEERLVQLKRARLEVERERAEQTRRELALEIEKERRRAQERAEAQRKELDLRVEDVDPDAPETAAPGAEAPGAEAPGAGRR